MRGALTGVLSRINRLADRVRPSSRDLDAKIGAMSDEELHGRMVELVLRVTGPVEEFESFDDFTKACFTNTDFPREESPGLLTVLREHWEQRRSTEV